MHPHTTKLLPTNVIDRISAALATQYNTSKSVAKHHIPQQIDQWGKVCQIDGGDTMSAALLGQISSLLIKVAGLLYQ